MKKSDSPSPADISAYLVCGDDDFLVKEAAKEIVAQLVPPDMRAMGLETIDGDCPSDDACAAMRRCLESLVTPGFFGGVKLTWLKDATFLNATRLKGDTETLGELVRELARRVKEGAIAPDLPLLVSTTAVNRGSSLFKAVAARGKVKDFGSGQKAYELDRIAGAHLEERLRELGLRMDSRAKDAFINRVGSDMRRLESELEKLGTYVGEAGCATADDVEAVVSRGRETAGWDLQDAFGERDATRLVRAFRALVAQGENIIALSAMLDNRVRDLLVMREALDRGWVAREGRGLRWGALPPDVEEWFGADPRSDFRQGSSWRSSRIADQAARWRLNELRFARFRLVELREKLVSSSLPGEFVMESTLLRCIGKKR